MLLTENKKAILFDSERWASNEMLPMKVTQLIDKEIS